VLIEWGANLSSSDDVGRTVVQKQLEAARLLLTNHVNVNAKSGHQESVSPLHTAASAGHSGGMQGLFTRPPRARWLTLALRSSSASVHRGLF